MQLSLNYNLPFAIVTVSYQGEALEIPDVLVDTGSSSTVLSADLLSTIHITPIAEDALHTISGIGGSEVVFTRRIDYLQIGQKKIPNFEIEIGGMDYGFQINGILGIDYFVNNREMTQSLGGNPWNRFAFLPRRFEAKCNPAVPFWFVAMKRTLNLKK